MRPFIVSAGMLAALASAACSSTPLAMSRNSLTVDGGPGSNLPASNPSPTDTCIQLEQHDGAPVWTSNSVTLSITNRGAAGPAAFSDCSDPDERTTWSLDVPSGHLGKTGCINGKPIDRASDLSADQRSQVVTSLHALRTTAVQGTIADAPEIAVVVTDAQGGSSAYSGFPWFPSATAVPTIASGALACLENLLDSFVDRPALLGEWCNDVAACASGLTCRADDEAGIAISYCHAD